MSRKIEGRERPHQAGVVSALRDAEFAASPLLSQAKRTDAVVLAVEELFDLVDVLALGIDVLSKVISCMAEDADRETLETVLAALFGPRGQWQTNVRQAADSIRRLSPENLERFIAQRERAKWNQPFLSTDRSPRRRVQVLEGQRVSDGTVIGPDGTVIGHDHSLPR
jgi:hypothetical protein